MEFEGQYLTYDEYLDLDGSLKDETSFNLLEFEARKIIDSMTRNRIKHMVIKPQEVKICVYTMIDTLEQYASDKSNKVNMNIASENTDGYSVSYITGSQVQDIIKLKKTELINIIQTYLGDVRTSDGTPVLYWGF